MAQGAARFPVLSDWHVAVEGGAERVQNRWASDRAQDFPDEYHNNW